MRSSATRPSPRLLSSPLLTASCRAARAFCRTPSGFTETGRRVWGGGQVKVAESEWVAWPLDLLMLHVIRRRSQAQRAIHSGEALFQRREAAKEAEVEPTPCSRRTRWARA